MSKSNIKSVIIYLYPIKGVHPKTEVEKRMQWAKDNEAYYTSLDDFCKSVSGADLTHFEINYKLEKN